MVSIAWTSGELLVATMELVEACTGCARPPSRAQEEEAGAEEEEEGRTRVVCVGWVAALFETGGAARKRRLGGEADARWRGESSVRSNMVK
jgi:hypothetical protein